MAGKGTASHCGAFIGTFDLHEQTSERTSGGRRKLDHFWTWSPRPRHATPRRNGGDTVEREKGIGVIGGVHTRRPVNARESKTLERVSILSYKYRNIIAASGLYTGHISIVKIERWLYGFYAACA